MQLGDHPAQVRVAQRRGVDRGAHQVGRQLIGVQIQHPLAETPRLVAQPLCGTCGGSRVTSSPKASRSCSSRSYRTAPSSTSKRVQFDTKIGVLLRGDRLTRQRLNVTAFLVSGIGTVVPEVIGQPCADADNVE